MAGQSSCKLCNTALSPRYSCYATKVLVRNKDNTQGIAKYSSRSSVTEIQGLCKHLNGITYRPTGEGDYLAEGIQFALEQHNTLAA